MIMLIMLGGLATVAIGLAIAAFSSNKGANIEYWITQTFLGGERAYKAKGFVDVLNDGSMMAEHKIIEKGKETPIGRFHQKYLKSSSGKMLIMELEEYDVKRYRPKVLTKDTRKEKAILQKRDKNGNLVFNETPVLNKKGQPKTDRKGQPIMMKVPVYEEQEVDVRLVESLPNEDIDWMLANKDRWRKSLEEEKKPGKFWQFIQNYGGIIISGLIICIVAFYMVEFSNNMKTTSASIERALEHVDTGAQAEKVTKVMFEVLKNETFRQAVKPTVEPPETPPG